MGVTTSPSTPSDPPAGNGESSRKKNRNRSQAEEKPRGSLQELMHMLEKPAVKSSTQRGPAKPQRGPAKKQAGGSKKNRKRR